ncbi:MAG: tRNA uridine-5-carboxymethylaminomethyl(34) synthesis GTPase MnmE, partial [Flavobacteriaceae bacterium]
MTIQDTIVALATPSGSGAIGVIRVSGSKAIDFCNPIFFSRSRKSLLDQASHSVQLGLIKDGDRVIDEALVTVFKGQRSYTGEPSVEISCHGSYFILNEVIQLLVQKGCRVANAGEFTMRSF